MNETQKRILSRDEAITLLVDDSIDSGTQSPAYLRDIFWDGFKGFSNYTNEELYEALADGMDEEIEIVDDHAH